MYNIHLQLKIIISAKNASLSYVKLFIFIYNLPSAALENSLNQSEKFTRQLLTDMQALNKMLESGMIESGVKRIGAEQELYIIDDTWRPSPSVYELLQDLDDPRFTVEIAKFNIEINLDPIVFGGNCLSVFEEDINRMISRLRKAAADKGLKIIMVGILPTIRKSDLVSENLVEHPRYKVLCSVLNLERTIPYELRIRGVDELIARHDSPLFESCNTSFQVHMQANPGDALMLYNLSQALAGPVLACAVNSPLLLGKRLWKETRIALFQQAVDTRVISSYSREKSARVSFGTRWIDKTVLEVFYDNIARYNMLVSPELKEDSLQSLDEGKIPSLKALQIFNSTVWRWNRLCYGVSEGQPHLRIENRVLPSGPTVRDEISNAAFWLGLMSGVPDIYPDIKEVMAFEDAKENFINAARMGLDTKLKWVNGSNADASELILKELLPVSREGLRSENIPPNEIDLYLGIIEERVRTKRTGASWMIDSFTSLGEKALRQEAIVSLTAAMYKRQIKGDPVHMWDKAELEEAGIWLDRCRFVDQIMSTDLFVVKDNDLIDLAASIMNWKHIRHVPVEAENGKFAGLITSRIILKHYGSSSGDDSKPVFVRDIMLKNPVTVSPEAKTLDAISVMHKKKLGCLPVVKNEMLLGIVTEHDFMNLSANLIKEIADAIGSKGKEKK